MKYRIDLSYDGTNYGGWAIQPNQTTIQELVQQALTTALRCPIAITGSGRTDAGVHARHQVAHFTFLDPLDPSPLTYSLNGILPRDIRIQSITPVSDDFHARFSVKKKIYHYHCTTSQSPFHFRTSYFLHASPDIDRLQEALPLFLGTRDFSAFASSGCGSKNPVKTLYRLEFFPEEQGFRLEFEGDGFLYKMVRNITGTLLDIALGKRSAEEIPIIFASRKRTLAGKTAPAKGLFLHKVEYSN
ncbi:MAG: tRNA pseudouridine(38-40) synthase TruA [Chlamydiia bacterium]|nr:tRNA pseudouridine(38-40) synthase TruA [Chlamydiia bacterium]